MIAVLLLFFEEGLLCYLFGMNSANDETCVIVSLVLMAINTAALFIYITKRYESYRVEVSYALILSLIFKVSLLLWDYYGTSIFILPNSHIDSEQFHRGAVYFAQYGINRVENYSYVVGLIYRFFGIQRMTAQFFNVILSFIGIDVFERIMHKFDISETGRERALFICALLPNYAIMSSILIRECVISVILCIALYFFSCWWSDGSLIYLLFAEVVSLSACWFHSGAIAVTIGMAIAVVITRKNNEGVRYLSVGITSVLLSVVLFIVFMYLFNVLSDSLLKRFHGLDIDVIDNYINEHNFYTETDGSSSSYAAGTGGISGIAGVIINSPVRILYFLWAPMPWRFRGIQDLIAFIGSSMFYGGTVTAGIYSLLRRSENQRDISRVTVVLVIALCAALVFAWGIDSAGSALRHREKFCFIYLLLFALLSDNHIEETEMRDD